MKNSLLSITAFLILSICGLTCFAQKIEVLAGVSGNLYDYSGSLSSSQTQYYGGTNPNYYRYPAYGTVFRAGYGADIKLKYIYKDGFIVGVGSGYDVTHSKADLSYAGIAYVIYGNMVYTGGGYTTTTAKQINANPYLGYRIQKKQYSIDLLFGAEIAFFVENKHREVSKGTFPSDNTFYYPNNNALNNGQDYRLKGGLDINYKKFTVNLSYAHSVLNLYKDGSYSNNSDNTSYNTLYSQVIRLGVAYRIF